VGSPIISDISGNAQLDLRAGIELAPDIKASTHDFCSLTHSRQSKVSRWLTL
jgi:hypothetical protein